MRKFLSTILIPLGISVLALWMATRNVNWAGILPMFSRINYFPFVLGFSVSLISLYLRAIRWQILLEPFQELSPWALLRWQIGGILVNNLLPLRMGEIARAYWAGHKSSIPKSAILATIVLERVLDVSCLAGIVVLLLSVMGLSRSSTPCLTPRNLAFASIALAAAFFTVRSILRRKGLEEVLLSVRNIFPGRLAHMIEHFISGLHVLKSKKEVFKLVLLSPVIWAVDIMVIAIMSRSFELNLSWMQAGLTMGGLILGVMIPAAPGAVGTYEAGGKQALVLMGFNPTLAFSFIALLHVMQIGFTFALGIPALMIEGFNPGKLYREMNSASTQADDLKPASRRRDAGLE